MKILLAAGVFYPDVGGPAIHVRKIAERLVEEGYEPIVLAYGDDLENKDFGFKIKRISRKHNKVMQWLLYFYYALRFAMTAKIVYAFDPTAAGFPACFAAKIFGRPFVIRVGGDPIWEREAEMGRRIIPIAQYYEQGLYIHDKPVLFRVIKWILKEANTLVVYNQNFKEFYIKYYEVVATKIKIIKNPVFRKENASPVLLDNPMIIFAGRFVTYKNLILVMKAFDNIRNRLGKGELLIIGKGPEEKILQELKDTLISKDHIQFKESLPQEKLFEKIKGSSIAIGPALSEFNPNFILESLSLGKPVILSKGHGLSVDLPEEFLFDPLSQEELEQKISYLFEPENYKKAVAVVDSLDMSQTWEKVTDFHLDLVRSLIK